MSIGTHLRFVLPIYLQVDVEHTLQSSKKKISILNLLFFWLSYMVIVALIVTQVKAWVGWIPDWQLWWLARRLDTVTKILVRLIETF